MTLKKNYVINLKKIILQLLPCFWSLSANFTRDLSNRLSLPFLAGRNPPSPVKKEYKKSH
jgi:hypothetical protein